MLQQVVLLLLLAALIVISAFQSERYLAYANPKFDKTVNVGSTSGGAGFDACMQREKWPCSAGRNAAGAAAQALLLCSK